MTVEMAIEDGFPHLMPTARIPRPVGYRPPSPSNNSAERSGKPTPPAQHAAIDTAVTNTPRAQAITLLADGAATHAQLLADILPGLAESWD
ncbi:hypothetical protein [Nocardia sp. NPDC051832]|uniref:hypothetical protein n=1 Tax=Nocardia sp. NPDC051832 TaxID=3155673 RepID=UPI003428E029